MFKSFFWETSLRLRPFHLLQIVPGFRLCLSELIVFHWTGVEVSISQVMYLVRVSNFLHFLFLHLVADQSSKAQISNEARRLVGVISQFVRVLGPVDQIGLSGNVLSQMKQQSTLIIHGLAHAAMIFLIKIRLSASPILDHNVINIGLGHCSEISKILEKLSSIEQSFVDPISSVCIVSPVCP